MLPNSKNAKVFAPQKLEQSLDSCQTKVWTPSLRLDGLK